MPKQSEWHGLRLTAVVLITCWASAAAAPPGDAGRVAADGADAVEARADGAAAAADATAETLQPLQATGPAGKVIELPEPPPDVAQLIRLGNVTFTLYDPQQDPQEFAGLTQFDLRYRYRATSRWSVRRIGGQRQLQIQPRFDRLQLVYRHEVLLPVSVQGEDFFDHPLVRHELDHVRITTDPRLQAIFDRGIEADVRQLTVPLSATEQPDGKRVREHVETAIQKVFQRLIDMARIRYDELDRETDHGQRPVPADFFRRIQATDAVSSG